MAGNTAMLVTDLQLFTICYGYLAQARGQGEIWRNCREQQGESAAVQRALPHWPAA